MYINKISDIKDLEVYTYKTLLIQIHFKPTI